VLTHCNSNNLFLPPPQVFPEGLAPLGYKIDRLIERTVRHAERTLAGAQGGSRPATAPAQDVLGGGGGGYGASHGVGFGAAAAADASFEPGGSGRHSQVAQRLERVLAIRSPEAGAASTSPLASPSRGPYSPGGGGLGSPQWEGGSVGGGYGFLGGGSLPGSPSQPGGGRPLKPSGDYSALLRSPRPGQFSLRPPNSPAALTAAGVMWDRSQETGTPCMRQCLTYEEISMLKKSSVAEVLAETAAATRSPSSRPDTFSTRPSIQG
jgi:hypothetical protein